MSSLREITCGISPEEQEIKARKELEYQTQLKLQIDEKKRLKIQEKRKQEELKRKELEEYYRLCDLYPALLIFKLEKFYCFIFRFTYVGHIIRVISLEINCKN